MSMRIGQQNKLTIWIKEAIHLLIREEQDKSVDRDEGWDATDVVMSVTN